MTDAIAKYTFDVINKICFFFYFGLDWIQVKSDTKTINK